MYNLLRFFIIYLSIAFFSVYAQEEPHTRWQRFKQHIREDREIRPLNKGAVLGNESIGAKTENIHQDHYEGRDLLVYIPSTIPQQKQRKLLIALHGGGGNAQFMREHLKIDGIAERNGFIVAYLNGSDATRAHISNRELKAWNAGRGCCGKPFTHKVDDIGYISSTVHYLQNIYHISTEHTFGVGHSNGAMMMQTLSCVTNVFHKIVSLAGTLMADTDICPTAHGHTIYNYHGSDDKNVPIAGGFGTQGVTNIAFTPQDKAKKSFEMAGGNYNLHIIPGATHSIESISAELKNQTGFTIGQRLTHDLGLAK